MILDPRLHGDDELRCSGRLFQQPVRDCRPCLNHVGAGSQKNAPRNEKLGLFQRPAGCFLMGVPMQQRTDPGQFIFTASSRFPQIHGSLCIQPELGRIPEKLRQAQRHHGSNCPPFIQQFIDRLPRYPECSRKGRRRHAIIRQKILAEHFSGVDRTYHSCSGIFNSHRCPLSDNP